MKRQSQRHRWSVLVASALVTFALVVAGSRSVAVSASAQQSPEQLLTEVTTFTTKMLSAPSPCPFLGDFRALIAKAVAAYPDMRDGLAPTVDAVASSCKDAPAAKTAPPNPSVDYCLDHMNYSGKGNSPNLPPDATRDRSVPGLDFAASCRLEEATMKYEFAKICQNGDLVEYESFAKLNRSEAEARMARINGYHQPSEIYPARVAGNVLDLCLVKTRLRQLDAGRR